MRIIKEEPLEYHQFWSGAADNAAELTFEELQRLDQLLTLEYPEGINETELNDLFWFDMKYINALLGKKCEED